MIRTLYIYLRKDVGIRGYFSKSKRAREQKDRGTLHYREIIAVYRTSRCSRTLYKYVLEMFSLNLGPVIGYTDLRFFASFLSPSRQQSAYYLD